MPGGCGKYPHMSYDPPVWVWKSGLRERSLVSWLRLVDHDVPSHSQEG